MKPLPLLFVFCGILSISHGQVSPDSLAQRLSSAWKKSTVDSLHQSLQTLPDSLLPALHKINSLRNRFNLAADSIQAKYQKSIIKIDAEANKLNQTIDSLQHLQLPIERYTKRLDSLNSLRQTAETKFASRLNALKAKTTEKLNGINLPPEFQEPLQELTRTMNDLGIDSDVVKIPELKIPGYTLPEFEGLGDLTSKAGDIGQIANVDKLADIDTPVGDLGGITQHAKDYQEDLKNITNGNLDDVQALPETIEQQATKIEGMDELQKQSGVIDQHKAQLQNLNDPDNAKKKAVEVARKAATNHFAGKQEQLKSAMEKISKYKQKYSSVSSIKDLPKRPPNPMKGKPFIERLVPGLYLQYQQKNHYLLDVNPYVGYKLSGRFTAGLGWNHRYAYDKDNRSFNSRSRIFGPRAYVDFKLGKGFIAHLEGESMNTFVPSTLRGNPDNGHREWVESFMTGIKKEYKIYKNLKGTALIQYNLFNRYYKAPYVDRLNSRVGFEYAIRGKKNAKGGKQK